MQIFLKLILPLKLAWEPWYSCGDASVVPGSRVRVTFAHRKYVAVVHTLSENPDIEPDKILPIDGTADELPPVNANEIQLWEFVAEYYMCTIGEVYKAAYPASRIRSEQNSAAAAERHRLSVEKMKASLEQRLARMEARSVLKNGKPSEFAQQQMAKIREALSKFEMPSGASAEEEPDIRPAAPGKPLLLSGPGRNGRYIRAIEDCIESGRDALVLVPQTDFSDILEEELVKAFPSQLRCCDYRLSAASRRKVADAVRDQASPDVILGTRSALFLPFRGLGLIIVDEEQDPGYKQTEPSPRYNARDLALVLGQIHGAQVILGSADASLETVYNCITGKYRLEKINSDADLPEVSVIDLSEEIRKNGVRGCFSYKMKEALMNLCNEGMVTLIRGWEDESEVAGQAGEFLPEDGFRILTAEACRKSCHRSAVIAVLQADSLFRKDDFRADEKALHILSSLRTRADHLIIQTGKSQHPVFAALTGGDDISGRLLEERKRFGLPPYTKMINVLDGGGKVADRVFLPRNASLAKSKKALSAQYPKEYMFDVDPV